MTVETFLGIVLLIGTAISYLGYRWGSENVYIRPKKYRVEYYMKRSAQKAGGKR